MKLPKSQPATAGFLVLGGGGLSGIRSYQIPVNAGGGIRLGQVIYRKLCPRQIFQGIICFRAKFPIAPLAVGFVQPLVELGGGELGMAAQE